MATPTRTSILSTIQTTLEGITVANGFKTTVDTVEPYLRGRDDVEEGERPYLGFGFDTEPYDHQMFGNMRVATRWFVTGCVDTGATWATMSAALNNLIDDIIGAIGADDTLGTYATQTKVVASDSDESDPDALKSGYAWCFVEFETVYYRETTSS
jgi:hypothetical protein